MFHLDKKPRLGAPAPAPTPVTALTHVTGPAAVHILFVRLAMATTARQALGMPAVVTVDDVYPFFWASWRVMNHDNMTWIISNELHAVASLAEHRLQWAIHALWAELEAAEEM